MGSGTNQPPGTVQLANLAAEWAEQETINPRFLASELADFLRTLPLDQHLDRRIVSPVLFDPVTGPGGITAASLADYFEGASQGACPKTIITSVGAAPAGAVLISRSWINQATKEATQRAAFVAGLVMVANDCDSLSMIVGGATNASTAPNVAPSGSEPGYLKMRQAQQRKEAERSAAEQLDAERTSRKKADLELAELRGMLAAKDAELTRRGENEQRLERENNDLKRAGLDDSNIIFELEAQLEDAMALAECLRVDNPLSPPEMRLAFQCWRDLTQDGTLNISEARGCGVHGLVIKWLGANGHQLNKEETSRLCATVSWRKRGSGAVRSK